MENLKNPVILESYPDYDLVECDIEEEIQDIDKLYEYEEILNAKYNANALVAEDNAINQKLIKYILINFGIKPYIVSNGQIALELRKKYMFDIILMDMAMPVLDGVAARAQIVKFEQDNNISHTPIIAVTAIALSGDKQRFLNIGFDGYCPKPIKKDEIAHILNDFLYSKRVGGEVQTKVVTKRVVKKVLKSAPAEVEQKPAYDEDLNENQASLSKQRDILICKKNNTENRVYSMVLANIAKSNDIANDFDEAMKFMKNYHYKVVIIDDLTPNYDISKFLEIDKDFKAILFTDEYDESLEMCFDKIHKNSINKADLILMVKSLLEE